MKVKIRKEFRYILIYLKLLIYSLQKTVVKSYPPRGVHRCSNAKEESAWPVSAQPVRPAEVTGPMGNTVRKVTPRFPYSPQRVQTLCQSHQETRLD